MKILGYWIIKDQPHHFIEFLWDRWIIQHSLQCRVQGNLLDCPITEAVESDTFLGPPVSIGKYRIKVVGSSPKHGLEIKYVEA